MRTGPILLIAMLCFVGCSKSAPPKHFDQLTLTYTPFQQPQVQRQVPIVFVEVYGSTSNSSDANGSLVAFGEHSLCFANYDLSEKPERPNTKILEDVPPGSDIAPIKACITINDKEGTNAGSPLQPGTYFIGLTNRMPDRIAGAGIFWDKGKLGASSLFHLAQMKGQLTLDSVSDDEFSGAVDLNDGENSIVATFKGKAKINKYK